MTPAAKVLIGLAEEVARAEKSLTEGPLYWARSKVESVTRSVAAGEPLNSLGELQATGPALDVAVARLETAARAFESALCQAGKPPWDTPRPSDSPTNVLDTGA
jgi:hypothetical protein